MAGGRPRPVDPTPASEDAAAAEAAKLARERRRQREYLWNNPDVWGPPPFWLRAVSGLECGSALLCRFCFSVSSVFCFPNKAETGQTKAAEQSTAALQRPNNTILVSHEWNFRAHPDEQKDALWALYQEVGFDRSLLAFELPDGRLKLIDGHLRRDIDPDMQVEVEILDVSEDKARELLLSIDPLDSGHSKENNHRRDNCKGAARRGQRQKG